MKAHQKTIGMNDEWLTPRWILDALGEFDLDPCAAVNMPWQTAAYMLNKTDDGLTAEWLKDERVWMNPPFSRDERPKWMRRMAEHGNGIMLIPAACETEPFQRYVFGAASGILMMNRRPHFCYVDGTEAKANSGCTICLCAYGDDNLEALKNSGLGTVLVEA